MAAALLALGACESPSGTTAAPEAAPVDERAPDVARGELLSLACQACHTLAAGGVHMVGPNLHGIFGRAAGTQPGFEYSAALRARDLVWTPEAVDAWLADPAGFLVGTTMAFSGYRSARDRRDLVAYLVRATSAPPTP